MEWIAVGDVHEDTANLARIPGVGAADGLILSGDLTNRGSEATARRVLGAALAANPIVYAQLGNMDTEAVPRIIDELCVNIHLQAVNLDSGTEHGSLCIFGVGMSTFTPFSTPSEVSDEQLGRWLDQVWARAKAFDHQLAVIHNPPVDTVTDRLTSGAHVGSPAVRAFLEKAQPEVCVTGHIHESRGMDQVGKTLVVNPGMPGQGGYVRVTWAKGKLDAALETL